MRERLCHMMSKRLFSSAMLARDVATRRRRRNSWFCRFTPWSLDDAYRGIGTAHIIYLLSARRGPIRSMDLKFAMKIRRRQTGIMQMIAEETGVHQRTTAPAPQYKRCSDVRAL